MERVEECPALLHKLARYKRLEGPQLETGAPVVPQQSGIAQEDYRPEGMLWQGGSSWPARKKLISETLEDTWRLSWSSWPFLPHCPEIRRHCGHPLPPFIPKKHSHVNWPQHSNPSLRQWFFKIILFNWLPPPDPTSFLKVIFLEQKNTQGHTPVSPSHLACLPTLQLYALHLRDNGVTFGGSMPHLAPVMA